MKPSQSETTLLNLPDSERPRERLLTHGAAALSAAELLAIILVTGSRQENAVQLSQKILARFGGLNGLSQATPADLEAVHGMGKAKIAQLMAALEISRRLRAATSDERAVIRTSADAARLVLDMGDLPQEHIRVILLDTTNRVIATPTVYKGTVNAAILRISEIYREAIARNAPAVILAHNHPSGDPTPSPEDVQLTRRLYEAGKLLDIALLDHIIVGHQSWRSLKEMRLLEF